MEHTTYLRPMQLPACYAVLSEEEMTYVDGGFTFTIGKYEVSVDTDLMMQDLMINTVIVSLNILGLFGQYAYNTAINGAQTGLADGMSLGGTIVHYWGKLNGWSKVASLGMAAVGGYYAFAQARSLYYTIKNIYDAFMDSYNQYLADQQAGLAA